MQDLSVFDGVDIEAAEAVCAQYGARLATGLLLLPGGDSGPAGGGESWRSQSVPRTSKA